VNIHDIWRNWTPPPCPTCGTPMKTLSGNHGYACPNGGTATRHGACDPEARKGEEVANG
jgi:tRNA(Ile2) C34 agmatinyltransferase TiaS